MKKTKKIYLATILCSFFMFGIIGTFGFKNDAKVGLWAAKKVSDNEYVQAGVAGSVGAAGGYGGAWAGAKIGAAIGTAGGPIGNVVGGIIGAGVGAL